MIIVQFRFFEFNILVRTGVGKVTRASGKHLSFFQAGRSSNTIFIIGCLVYPLFFNLDHSWNLSFQFSSYYKCPDLDQRLEQYCILSWIATRFDNLPTDYIFKLLRWFFINNTFFCCNLSRKVSREKYIIFENAENSW